MIEILIIIKILDEIVFKNSVKINANGKFMGDIISEAKKNFIEKKYRQNIRLINVTAYKEKCGHDVVIDIIKHKAVDGLKYVINFMAETNISKDQIEKQEKYLKSLKKKIKKEEENYQELKCKINGLEKEERAFHLMLEDMKTNAKSGIGQQEQGPSTSTAGKDAAANAALMPIQFYHPKAFTERCKFYDKGYCRNGDECTFVHGDRPNLKRRRVYEYHYVSSDGQIKKGKDGERNE